jgi:YD repeat-containing protein
MRTILVLLLVLGTGCGGDLDYGSARSEAGPDVQAPAKPAPGPALAVAPTHAETRCEVQSALSRDDLEFENELVVDAARVEDHVDGEGTLTGRTLRGEGWQREELYGADGCLGILTLSEFNDAGDPLRVEVFVLDGQLAFDLSPYGGIVPSLSTWEYDDRGQLERWVRQGQEIFYTYDDAGNVIQDDSPYGEDRLITTRTFDEHGQLLTEIAVAGDNELFRLSNTWAGPGRQLSTARTEGGRTSGAEWFYEGERLLRRVSREDWDGDRRPEREEVETYDERGNKIEFTQDQPYDGNKDWRETFVHDDADNLVHHQAHNLATGELMRDVRYTYDDDGRQRTQVQRDGRRSETDYDEDGRVIRAAWFRPGGALQMETVTAFAPNGQMLRTEFDQDGDGVIDAIQTQELDLAGQPVISSNDWDADGTAEASILRLWR